MICLWRGFHSHDLVELLRKSWQSSELVILVPAHQKNFSFVGLFDATQISFHGDWPEALTKTVFAQASIPVKVQDRECLGQAVLGVFTSGTSSGASRLVFYSRENVQASLAAIRELYDLSRLQKIFTYPQPTHTFGLVLGYMHAILNNLKLDFFAGLYSKKTHEHWLSVVDENTLTLGTPTHFMDLLHFVKGQGQTPRPSYSAIIGGARTTQKLWQQMQSVLNIEAPSVGYGATEASPGVTHLRPGVPPKEDGDIGYVLSGVTVEVIPDEGILFAGKNLCLAIFENGELRKFDKILLRDQLLEDHSGQGERYTFVGRTDLLLNRGGSKLSLEVVEGLVASHFECKCLAVAIFDERLGEDLGLLIQLNPSRPAEFSKQEVRDFLQRELGFLLPFENILLAEVPLTANGKMHRKEALKLVLQQRSWSFPVAIGHVRDFLPHRGPAVWIESLLETSKNYGVGRVLLHEGSHCFSGNRVRESSCVEWIAQTYGYTVALNNILGLDDAKQTTKVFIAEVKNAEFDFLNADLMPQEELRVTVRCTHDFGNLKVVHGQVFYQQNMLARMDMKLYCAD